MKAKWQASPTLKVCDHLRVPIDGARLTNLLRRLEREGVGIAIIGLVGRGKSTLVNQLVGANLCKVDATPETAAVVAITRKEPRAFGRTANGTMVDLPTDPNLFRTALERSGAAGIRDAEYFGDVRLPHGVTLIDTPGIDEAMADSEVELVRLKANWAASGAAAAVQVLSYPPGTAAGDLRLLEAAQATFEGGVQVVLKATDSSVTADDLQETAEHLRTIRSVNAMILEPGEGAAEWRHGALSNLEERIDRYANEGKRSRSVDQTDVEAIVLEAAAMVELLGEERLKALEELAAADLSAVAPQLSAAVATRAAQLRGVVNSRVAAAAMKERARLVAFLDDSARLLAAGLPRRLSDADMSLHSATYRELVRLASEGSAVGARSIRQIFDATEAVRLRMGFGFSPTITVVPDQLWGEALDDVQLSPMELLDLVKVGRKRPTTVSVVRGTVLRNCKRQSTASQLKPLLSATSDPQLRTELLELYTTQVLTEFKAAGTAWNQVDEQSFSRVHALSELATELLTLDLQSSRRQTTSKRVTELRAWMSRLTVFHLDRYAHTLTSSAVESRAEWDRSRGLDTAFPCGAKK